MTIIPYITGTAEKISKISIFSIYVRNSSSVAQKRATDCRISDMKELR